MSAMYALVIEKFNQGNGAFGVAIDRGEVEDGRPLAFDALTLPLISENWIST